MRLATELAAQISVVADNKRTGLSQAARQGLAQRDAEFSTIAIRLERPLIGRALREGRVGA